MRIISFSTILFFMLFSYIRADEQHRSSLLNDLEKKVQELTNNYDILQKYVFNIQSVNKDAGASNTSILQDEIISQIKSIKSELIKINKEIVVLHKYIKENEQDLNKKIDILESNNKEKDYELRILDAIDRELSITSKLERNDEEDSLSEKGSFKKLKLEEEKYNAILKLINEKKHNEALIQLKEFITSHPNSALDSNVFFYIGEIYYMKHDYKSASINYLRGYQVDKQGNRSISNLLMLTKSFLKLGKYEKACEVVKFTEYSFNKIPTSIMRDLDDIKMVAKCSEIK